MAKCVKCNISAQAFVCDNCKEPLCKACSELTATEIQCMNLLRRKLMFYCGNCQVNSSIVSSQSPRMANFDPAQLEALECKITSAMDLKFLSTENSITSLSTLITDLKDSNCELIQLLQNSNQKLNPTPSGSKSKSQEAAPNNEHRSELKQQKKLAPTLSNEGNKPLDNACRRVDLEGTMSKRKPGKPIAKRSLLVGTGANTGLSAAIRRKYFHINNVDPGTSKDAVSKFIKDKLLITDASCDALTSNDIFCSFKVGIRESDADKFLNPAAWAKNISIRDFYFNRKPKNHSGNFTKPSPSNFLSESPTLDPINQH